MPLGILSDEAFEKELNRINSNNESNESDDSDVIAEVVDINKGRGDKKEVPESVRKVIGEEKVLGSDSKELAEIFKVSESSVSAYGNGARSTANYNEGNGELKTHVDSIRDKIANKARVRLINAIHHITPEKLAESKIKDLSQIAKDMSVVIKNIEPQTNTPSLGVQFVFFAPKLKQESDYDVIAISDR
jgi:predicted transcriptional regulator